MGHPPYGDALSCTGSGSDPTEQHFTGKERDSESGNDYFFARYYSSSMGRFLSPDWAAKAEPVPYAKMENPQSLNLYAYVENDPPTSLDADGHQIRKGFIDLAPCNAADNTNCNAGEQKKLRKQQQPKQRTNKRKVAKGAGEVTVGVVITAGVILTPETGGTSAAAIPILLGVLGGEGVAAKGTVDIADGLNLTDSKTASDGKEAIDIGTNPASALALPITGRQTALDIGTVVNGAMGARDLTTLPTNIPGVITKGASAWSVSGAYSTTKQFMNQVVTNFKNWISPVSVY